MTIKDNLTKEKRVEAEKKRLSGIFKEIDKDKKAVVKSLLSNAAFMAVTLEDLQQDILLYGTVTEWHNGPNQHGLRKSPHVDNYNAMLKNYLGVIKQLLALLPEDTKTDPGEELMRFVAEGNRKRLSR